MVRNARARATVIAFVVGASTALGGGWWAPASAATYSTQAAPSWVPDAAVKSMTRIGNVVYIGGSFTKLTNPLNGTVAPRNHVAALDITTGAPLPWNPGADGVVTALTTAPDGTVYLGGDFLNVTGQPATRLAAVTPAVDPVDGTPGPDPATLVSTFKPTVNNTVSDLYVSGGSLYVAGRFFLINGRNRPKLAKVNATTGALDTTFNALVTGGRVDAVAPSTDGQSLYLGGSFTSVGGSSRSFAATVSLANGAVGGWNPAPLCSDCAVEDIAVTDTTVVAGTAGGGGHLGAWDAASGGKAKWSIFADGNVQAVDVYDGVAYAGGHFGPHFDKVTRYQLAAVDVASGRVLDYQLAFNGSPWPGIFAVDADADGLRIGGAFLMSGNKAKRYALLPLVP